MLITPSQAAPALDPGCGFRHAAPPSRRQFSVPILMYHRINAVTPRAASRGLTVHPRNFERHMKWLHLRGFRTITLRQLLDAFVCGRPLPPRSIMLTFDDGYRDVFFKASPVLLSLNMRATAYVVSGRISAGDPSFLTWPLLRALERRGIEVASHTVAHRDLTTLADKALLAELTTSRRALERGLRHQVRSLAYPFGAYDARVVRAARQAGYALAVTTRIGVVRRGSRPLELPRLRVLDTTTVAGIAALLANARGA